MIKGHLRLRQLCLGIAQSTSGIWRNHDLTITGLIIQVGNADPETNFTRTLNKDFLPKSGAVLEVEFFLFLPQWDCRRRSDRPRHRGHLRPPRPTEMTLSRRRCRRRVLAAIAITW